MTLVMAAVGQVPLDLLIRDVRVANVLTGEIYPAQIGVWGDWIACVEAPDATPPREARRVLDGGGRLAVPGLVDSHLHIESTLVTPARFAEGVLPHGTTTVAEDPHEIANAMGLAGVRLLWQASRGLPLKTVFLVPTCVPSAGGLETAGGDMGPAEVRQMLAWEDVLGLAEVMDAQAVVTGDTRMTAIVAEGRLTGRVIEGHNPMLEGRDLQGYVAAGVDSDHTLATPERLIEKLRLGVTLQLQERYLSEAVVAAVNQYPLADVCLVTDDVAPDYLEEHGHLDQVLRTAIRLGMPPMAALRAATLNPARRLRLYDRGVIAPGRLADLVLVDGLETFNVSTVVVDGRVVVDDGQMMWRAGERDEFAQARDTVRLGRLTAEDFAVRVEVEAGRVRARTIVALPGETRTREGETEVSIRSGRVELEAADAAAVAVFHRYGRVASRAHGLVQGLGLTSGAIATTYAHDSHNLAVFGKNAEDMALAANAVIEAGGGMVVARDGAVLARVALPVAGIISQASVGEVAQAVRGFTAACAAVGVEHPYLLMRISTFTLPVSSGLRITDMGLVDANRRQLVSLWP